MDPITFALIAAAAFWVTDTASSGLLRAEVGGGFAGAFGGVGRSWWSRRVRTHQRRQKARTKTRAGRIVNYVQDEGKAYVAGVREGWPEGRRRAHERRRQRWEAKPPWWRRLFGPSDPEPEDETVDPESSGSEGLTSEPSTPEGGAEGQPEATTSTGSSTPNGAASAVPNDPRGSSTVGDLNTAQAVIAAWEALKSRIEQVKADLKQISGDASGLADGAGSFKVGTEDDGVKALDNAVAWLGGAEERIDSVVASIHDDFDASIEASEGKRAEVHSAFQGG